MASFEPYITPLVPFMTRALLGVRWSWLMADQLKEEEQDRDTLRGYVLTLAGFSFTAVVALVVLEAHLQVRLQLSIWFVLVSFLTFIASLNLHAYKSSRWQNQLAAALQEVGTLALILALVSLILLAEFSSEFKWSATALCFSVWVIDHCARLWIEHAYFRELDSLARRK